MSQVTFGLSFLAGLASFLSPCVLSLVPAYVGYLGGQSAASGNNESRQRTFLHGLAFAAGFSLVFILFGIGFAVLGGLLQDLRELLSKIGGAVVILLGLHMTGLLRFSFLEYDTRVTLNRTKELGFLSSFIMGISFSAGWSPCIGPVLGTILTLVMNEGNILSGVVYLSAYSLGMAIPFLLAAVTIGWASRIIRKYNKFMHYIEVAMGVVMVLLGLFLFMGIFEKFAAFGAIVDFGI